MNSEVSEVIEIERISTALPQKYPFLFVDKVIELKPCRYIHARKNVSYNEWFFQGHFPSNPVLPGNIIIEAMAQTTGLILLDDAVNIEKKGLRPGHLVQCNVKFLHVATVGDILDIKAKTKILSEVCLSAAVTVHVDRIAIASGEITIAFKK